MWWTSRLTDAGQQVRYGQVLLVLQVRCGQVLLVLLPVVVWEKQRPWNTFELLALDVWDSPLLLLFQLFQPAGVGLTTVLILLLLFRLHGELFDGELSEPAGEGLRTV